jgi:hypothetical protein
MWHVGRRGERVSAPLAVFDEVIGAPAHASTITNRVLGNSGASNKLITKANKLTAGLAE